MSPESGLPEFDALDLGICDNVNSAISCHMLETFKNFLTGGVYKNFQFNGGLRRGKVDFKSKELSGSGFLSASDFMIVMCLNNLVVIPF